MTKIIVFKKNDFFSISIKGHAEYAESGKDIVCAAISMLANEMIFAAQSAKKNGAVDDLGYKCGFGKFFMRFRIDDDYFLKYAIEPILECLRLIEQQYPENVSFHCEE